MNWRGTQAASRARYLAKFDAEEVERYDVWISQLTRADAESCLEDLRAVIEFRDGMHVLDAGAGTGALCWMLKEVPGLKLTALEPVPAMQTKFRSKPELVNIDVVSGFCDADTDRSLFPASAFDVIVSRQLANGLYDPLAAFRNWLHWLKPGGTALVLEGLYDRSAWTGVWEVEIDVLPLSACRTLAAVPYLMEQSGFQIQSVGMMRATNHMPSTRTPRYLIAGVKPHTSD